MLMQIDVWTCWPGSVVEGRVSVVVSFPLELPPASMIVLIDSTHESFDQTTHANPDQRDS